VVIAIDGPSGVGKSTVAEALALALDLPYLDTGSYYRAATLIALDAGVDPTDQARILEAMAGVSITVERGVMRLDGTRRDVELRSQPVTDAVSVVAAHPDVRAAIVEMQRDWVTEHGGDAVVEGRDIGTVVFPNALVKVFLEADAATRAARRAGDAEAAGTAIDALRRELERRDQADSTRTVSPLRPADDALIIETSDLSVAEVVGQVLDVVAERSMGG